MNNLKQGLKLKLIAYGLGIEKTRREILYAATFDMIQAFSQYKDVGRLALEMVGMTPRANELQFMCSSFDSILKKHYKSPMRARAVLVTELRRTVRPFLLP
jgi:hypothetical protein